MGAHACALVCHPRLCLGLAARCTARHSAWQRQLLNECLALIPALRRSDVLEMLHTRRRTCQCERRQHHRRQREGLGACHAFHLHTSSRGAQSTMCCCCACACRARLRPLARPKRGAVVARLVHCPALFRQNPSHRSVGAAAAAPAHLVARGGWLMRARRAARRAQQGTRRELRFGLLCAELIARVRGALLDRAEPGVGRRWRVVAAALPVRPGRQRSPPAGPGLFCRLTARE